MEKTRYTKRALLGIRVALSNNIRSSMLLVKANWLFHP
jgi:hypothetical protein